MLFGASEDTRGYRGATVTIGGTPYKAVGYPQVSRHLDNLRSSCSVTLDKEPPTFEVGQAVPAWVDMQFEGKSTVRVFTGYLGTVSIPFGARTITLVDNLFKLKNSPEMGCDETEAIFFNNLAPDAAMLKMLLSAGIAETDIDTTSLTSALVAISPTGSVSDATLRVCPLMPHCIEVNQKLEDLYRDLCTFLCIVGYCDADGKIRFVPKDTRPVENPPLSFDNDGGYPILDGQRERSGFEEVVRVCTCKLATIQIVGVQGADYTSKWVATAVENGVPYDVSISAPLVQTKPMADRLTTFYGELGCRQEQRFTVETARDPHLKPGIHALFRFNKPDHAPILPTATPGYIIGVEDNETRAKLTISTGPSEESGYQEGVKPVAVFTFQIIAERVLISGSPATIYDVFLDGSGSYDPDGAIVSYQWTVTGTTPRLSPSNVAQTMAVFDTLEDVIITLTVTDNHDPANTATFEQSLDAPGVVVQYRLLQAVKDGKWGVLPKDQWLWWSPPGTTATAVARSNEKGDLWCGCANGDLYRRSQNDFDQTPELTTTLDGAITDIYVGEPLVNEAAINSIIAAHGSKATWTHDAFTTTQSHDFGSPVTGMAVDPYTMTHLTALVGNEMMESWDDGVSWTELLAGAVGSVAEDVAVAPWDTCTVFSSATGADAIVFLSGAVWSGVTLSGEPQTVTPGVTEETFRVATSDSNLYLFTRQSDGSYLGTSIGQVDATSGNTKRWVRDGQFAAVYGADATQVFKQLVNDPTQIYPLTIGNAMKVGYAGLGIPQSFLSLELFLAPWGQTNTALDKLWHYVPDQGWEGLPLPRAGWYWQNIVVSPDGQYLALVGNDSNHHDSYQWYYDGTTVSSWSGRYPPIYYRHIADTTWTAVTLGVNGAQINMPDGIKAGCGWLEFVGDSLYCAGTVVRTDGRLVSFLDKVVIGGSTMANTTHTLFNYAGLKSAFGGAVVMQDGRIVFVVPSSDPNYMYYAEYPALVAYRPRMTDAFTAYGATIGGDTIIFANGGNLLGEGQLYYSENFKTTSVAQRFASGIAYSVDVDSLNRIFIASGWTQEIRRIDDITGAWGATVAERSNLPGASKIRSDRQTKTRLSAIHSSGIVVRESDGTWTNVAFPTGVERAKVAWCEPVMRER